MTEEHRHLRDALARYATGIAVATCSPPGAASVGITINSFTSVSLEPPLVLWCIEKTASVYKAFNASDHYAVNILGAHQVDVSQRFAAQDRHVIAAGEAEAWKTGAPILPGCLAYLDCKVENRYPAGDHDILVGRVVKYAHADNASPLLYYRSDYRAGPKVD